MAEGLGLWAIQGGRSGGVGLREFGGAGQAQEDRQGAPCLDFEEARQGYMVWLHGAYGLM